MARRWRELFQRAANGVFSLQQGAVCIGDCDASGSVTVDELLTLVSIALGDAEPSACVDGIPSGSQVDIAVIIRAADNALNGCAGYSETP